MDVNKGYVTLAGYNTFAIPEVEVVNNAGSIVSDVGISTLSGGVLTIAAQPDYPRTLNCFLTDANASITSATVTIVGMDASGNGISEVVSITAAGVAATSKAFAKVVSATWALVSGSVTGGSADLIAIGNGPALGLSAGPDATFIRLIKADFDGANDAGTFSATYGTYNPAGTMDNAKSVGVAFLYKVPIVQ